MKTLNILLDENRRVVSYCEFGETPGMIPIEVEDTFQWEGDIRNYRVTDEKLLVYDVDILRIKRKKREELKAIRDEKIDENIEVHDSVFQVREQDTSKFQMIGLGLALGKLKPEEKEYWVLADNTVKAFTNSQLIEVLIAKEARERTLFAKFVELDTKLQKATTVEEIEKIKWE